jgi:hypothetical protein
MARMPSPCRISPWPRVSCRTASEKDRSRITGFSCFCRSDLEKRMAHSQPAPDAGQDISDQDGPDRTGLAILCWRSREAGILSRRMSHARLDNAHQTAYYPATPPFDHRGDS